MAALLCTAVLEVVLQADVCETPDTPLSKVPLHFPIPLPRLCTFAVER